MGYNNITNIVVTLETSTPSQAGFGIPLVIAYHTVFAERYRIYTSADDMVTDGFGADDPAVRAVTKILSQNPKVTQVVVGRSENDQKQKINIVPIAFNSTEYIVTVNGQDASFTSDATATVAEITSGLKTAIDALSLNVTVTDNTTDIDIESNTVADVFSLYVNSRVLMTQQNVTPDLGGSSGIVDDIIAISQAYNDWYSIHLTNLGKAVILAAAAQVETLRRIMIVSSADDDILDSLSTTDVASSLQTADYTRTAIMYHPKALVQYPGAAWAGKCLPNDPGSITWAYQNLAGIDYTELTATEITTLEGKDCNYYTQYKGLNITLNGEMASNEWIDVIRSVDFIVARIEEALASLLYNSKKIPFTDPGATLVQNAVLGVMKLGVSQSIFTEDPEPTVTVPKVADVSSANKTNRKLPDVQAEGTLAGAIHYVDPINIYITV